MGPDMLHDIFLKTGNSRGGTEPLLNRNLTDKANSTSRFADSNTTTILAQCTYLLNRLVRLPTGQLPTFRISYVHMTTTLIVDTIMQLAHPTWIIGTPPGTLSLAYTDKFYCGDATVTTAPTTVPLSATARTAPPGSPDLPPRHPSSSLVTTDTLHH